MDYLNQDGSSVAEPDAVDARWVEVTYRLVDGRTGKCRGLRAPLGAALRASLNAGPKDVCVYTKPHRVLCVASESVIGVKPLLKRRLPRWSRRIQKEEACLNRLGLS